MKQILPICLFLLLMTGCKERPEVTASLDRAEELMESAPDSALTLLQTLDTETFLRRGTHARHALLFTQAQDKNYIDETNDSLISIAVDHYRQHGDVRSRFLSLYYNGRVLTNAGDPLNAMLSYAEAEELVEELRDNYYTGLLYTQMGDAYGEYYDFPKSLEAFHKASEYYARANKCSHRAYALWNQANICWQMNEYAECEQMYRSALDEARTLEDNILEEICLSELFMVYMEQGNTMEAHDIYQRLKDNFSLQDMSAKFCSVVAELYATEGNYNEMKAHMDEAWNRTRNAQDSISLYFADARINEMIGNHQMAYIHLNRGIQLQTSAMNNVLQQPILSLQCDYLKQELAFSNYRSKVTRGIWIILSMIFIMAVAFFLLQIRKHIKLKDESIRCYLKELASMKQVMENDRSEKNIQLQELFKDQFKIIDILGESFFREDDETKLQKDVYQKVKNLMEQYDRNNKLYIQFEELVNRYNDNVIHKLRKEMKLPENVYRQLCYHVAGFSVNVISVFMGESCDTLYKRRRRTLEKIARSELSFKGELLEKLT